MKGCIQCPAAQSTVKRCVWRDEGVQKQATLKFAAQALFMRLCACQKYATHCSTITMRHRNAPTKNTLRTTKQCAFTTPTTQPHTRLLRRRLSRTPPGPHALHTLRHTRCAAWLPSGRAATRPATQESHTPHPQPPHAAPTRPAFLRINHASVLGPKLHTLRRDSRKETPLFKLRKARGTWSAPKIVVRSPRPPRRVVRRSTQAARHACAARVATQKRLHHPSHHRVGRQQVLGTRHRGRVGHRVDV